MVRTRFSTAVLSLLNATRMILGATLLTTGLATAAFAQAAPATPEIDAGSAASAVALLFGGIMLLKDRFRAK